MNRPKPGAVIRRFMVGGDTVTFRYLKRSDLDPALEYINALIDEKVLKVVQTRQTLEQEKKWLAGNLKNMRSGETVVVVVEVNGKFSGSANVSKKPYDANRHMCRLGIGLHIEARGKGICTELVKTLCQQGRDVLGCSIAELSVYERNDIAIRLYKKIGFHEVGRIPNGVQHYGKFYDEIIMVREL
jgi:L-phenylalanine/L-methionine N-acetyltransferase